MTSDPLYEAITTLKTELMSLQQNVQSLTSTDAQIALLKRAFLTKIQQQLDDLDYLKEVYETRLAQLREAIENRPYLRTDYQALYNYIRRGVMNIRYALESVLTHIYGDVCAHLITMQQGDEQTRKFKLFLDRYLGELIIECWSLSRLSDRQIICLLGKEYASTGIFINESVFLISIPVYDLIQPWYWPILSHEIGHMIFYEIRDRFNYTRLLRRIANMLRRSAPERYRGDVINEYIAYWNRYWLREFCTDLIGLSLVGPSFSVALINNLSSYPGEFRANVLSTHPTLEARIAAQIMLLSIANFPENLKHEVRSRCEALSVGLGRRIGEEAEYPFTTDVLEMVVNAVYRGLNEHPPVIDKIDEIYDCCCALTEGKINTEDPFILVNSLIFSPQREDLLPRILEIIGAGQRSPP